MLQKLGIYITMGQSRAVGLAIEAGLENGAFVSVREFLRKSLAMAVIDKLKRIPRRHQPR